MPGAATIVGGIAAPCSAAGFLPQAWKMIRTRDTEAISTGMHAVTVFGVPSWLGCGLPLWPWPLIAANGVCLVLSAFILLMTVLPRHHEEKVAEVLDPAAG